MSAGCSTSEAITNMCDGVNPMSRHQQTMQLMLTQLVNNRFKENHWPSPMMSSCNLILFNSLVAAACPWLSVHHVHM